MQLFGVKATTFSTCLVLSLNRPALRASPRRSVTNWLGLAFDMVTAAHPVMPDNATMARKRARIMRVELHRLMTVTVLDAQRSMLPVRLTMTPARNTDTLSVLLRSRISIIRSLMFS